SIKGIAKGAGMIAPNMATMLAFVFTDAAIEPVALRASLDSSLEQSFNTVTIDSDTSTSDTLLVFATGAAAIRGAPRIAVAEDPRITAFRLVLAQVMPQLPLQLITH